MWIQLNPTRFKQDLKCIQQNFRSITERARVITQLLNWMSMKPAWQIFCGLSWPVRQGTIVYWTSKVMALYRRTSTLEHFARVHSGSVKLGHMTPWTGCSWLRRENSGEMTFLLLSLSSFSLPFSFFLFPIPATLSASDARRRASRRRGRVRLRRPLLASCVKC